MGSPEHTARQIVAVEARRMPHAPARQVSRPIRDPSVLPRRQRGMATPELISLIVALVLWIALLGSMAPEA
jgi:hypothetical protein